MRRVEGRALPGLLLAALLLLIPHAPVTLAQGDGQAVLQRFVLAHSAPLRARPAPGAPTVASLPAGTMVWSAAGPPADWRQVRLDHAATGGWVPQAALREVALLVAAEGVALRAAPHDRAAFVRVLPPATEAWAFADETVGGQRWLHVWSAGGVTGWAAEDHFRVRRVRALADLSLRPYPHAAESTARLGAGTVAVLLEAAPGGAWLRLRAPEGGQGWAQAHAVAPQPIAGVGSVRRTPPTLERGANLRAAPAPDAPVVGRLFAGAEVPVVGRDDSGDWLLVVTPRGRLAWLAGELVRLQQGLPLDLPVVPAPWHYGRT